MRRIEFAPQARADLIDIFNHIAGDNPAGAKIFVDRIEERCHDLLDFPGSGRSRAELAPDLRSKPHGRYVIYYTPGTDVVRVERILHGSRDAEATFGQKE